MIKYKSTQKKPLVTTKGDSRPLASRLILKVARGFFVFILLFQLSPHAQAHPIQLEAIKQIESSGDPLAFNKYSKARGLYQITPICLKEYNQFNNSSYNTSDLFNPSINKEIADWYFNRIGQMLSYYKIPLTIDNYLIAYNFGIGNLKKGKVLPTETVNYIKKYKGLTNEKR